MISQTGDEWWNKKGERGKTKLQGLTPSPPHTLASLSTMSPLHFLLKLVGLSSSITSNRIKNLMLDIWQDGFAIARWVDRRQTSGSNLRQKQVSKRNLCLSSCQQRESSFRIASNMCIYHAMYFFVYTNSCSLGASTFGFLVKIGKFTTVMLLQSHDCACGLW